MARCGTVSVPLNNGERVDVPAWSIPGTVRVVVSRATSGSGYVVTRVRDGMRMPGDFRTIKAARAAWQSLTVALPWAADFVDTVENGVWDERKRTITDAWRAIVRPQPARRPVMGSFRDLVVDVCASTGEDWHGDEDTVTCPCGHTIEHDGTCPSGHVSPLRAAGLV